MIVIRAVIFAVRQETRNTSTMTRMIQPVMFAVKQELSQLLQDPRRLLLSLMKLLQILRRPPPNPMRLLQSPRRPPPNPRRLLQILKRPLPNPMRLLPSPKIYPQPVLKKPPVTFPPILRQMRRLFSIKKRS